MNQRSVVRYRIDVHDRITEVSDDWTIFADANDAESLRPDAVIGRPILEFVADATTSALYRLMFHRLRRSGAPITFGFRCDSASLRRTLQMKMTAASSGAVQFEVTTLAVEGRPSVILMEAGHTPNGSLVIVCGWCKRVSLPTGAWVEVEEAVIALGLFEGQPVPGLSHGICKDCEKIMSAALDTLDQFEAGVVSVGAPLNR